MNKQTATFGGINGFIDKGHKGITANLADVEDHPILGNGAWVTTSRVLALTYDGNGEVMQVETRNTIYSRR